MNRYLDYHQMVIPPSNDMSTPFVDPRKVSQLNELLNENGNNKCADCGMQLTIETAWAVLSYGIFVCDDCKLVHIEEDGQFLAQIPGGNSSPEGFLPTNLYQHWNESDINQMKNNGNSKVNQKYLSNMPVWQYMPTGNDGIKHKEYWIKYKYGSPHTAAHDMPKTANKTFLGIQFTRPTPSEGNYPCCAVLQNDKLYLTSSVKNEEIEIEDIETVLLNSKRIGHENGVQLTYRVRNPDKSIQCDDVMYTYLQHDSMKVVLDWINLVLYHKYNICKNKYRTQGETNLSKMLNCEMLKEGYIPTPNHQFIYASLSEARIACFKHHLDDKPLLHMPVTKSTNLKPYQYLESVAYFFGMAADITKILGYDDWMAAFEKTMAVDKLACLPDGVVKTTIPKKLLAPRQEIKPVVPVEEKVEVIQAPKFTLEPDKLRANTPIEQEKLTNGSVKSSLSCYPPIGPMGEMGKVARGELPPEAIKPPPPKNDLNRMQLYGDYKPNIDSIRTSVPSPIDPVVNAMPMSGQMIQQPMTKSLQNCYPPIKGPMRDPGLRTLHESNSFESFAMNNNMPGPENDYVIDEYKGTISANYSQMSGRSMQNPGNFTNKSRTYSEAELMQYMNQQQNDWQGDGNLLTVPWKESRNGGFEPNRNFNSQFDSWNNNTMQDKRNKISGQMFQGNSFRHEMQQPLGRSASWNPSGQSMEQWGTSKQSSNDRYFGGMPSGKISRPAASSNQQVVMDYLHKCWVQAELKLHVLIHNGYVPAANMTAAGLDPNSSEHASTCITELFELLWKRHYDLALSFLRGFREVFSQSREVEIRKKFIGVGELDTMKQIFMQQGREKFLSANSGGPVTWKQPSVSPQTVEPQSQSWSSMTTARDSPTSFTSPWGALSPTTPTSESVWGPSRTSERSQSNSLDRDPWGPPATTQKTSGNFNRAPSRPISLTRSSFSENSPTEGSFGSKASSSSSASPRVITPPAGLDTAQASMGIESHLKHLFLSYPSGSTSWDS